MGTNCCTNLPEALWVDIFLSAGIDEWYLRPLSLISKQFLSVSNCLRRTLHISNRNAHCLSRLLQRFPNIKHINLPFFLDPERFFNEISHFGICLESLDMSLMRTFPVKRLKELPLFLLGTTLRSLKLTYMEDRSDVDGDLDIIAELLPNLEELELCWGYQVTENGVARFASKLKRLKKISFSWNHLITDLSIRSLCENCENMEEIALDHCSSISYEGISFLVRHFCNLKSLVLQKMYYTRDDDALAFARNLSMLDFSSMDVPDNLLLTIARANIPLKRFSMSNCGRFTLRGIWLLLDAYRFLLEYFAIEHLYSTSACQLKGENVVYLASYLRNCRTVKLNYCCHLSTKQLLALVHKCSRLNTLEIKGAKMSRDQEACTLRHDRKSQIRSVNLSFNEMLTDECLEKLALACPNLTELFVNGCKTISHRGVSHIMRNCQSLKIIHMNGCEGIARLGFDIRVAELEVLEARKSSLNDESLILIALKCLNLMCLDVSNCNELTALGVREVVMNCKNLWKLGVSFKHYIGSDLEYWIRSTKPWLVNC